MTNLNAYLFHNVFFQVSSNVTWICHRSCEYLTITDLLAMQETDCHYTHESRNKHSLKATTSIR